MTVGRGWLVWPPLSLVLSWGSGSWWTQVPTRTRKWLAHLAGIGSRDCWRKSVYSWLWETGNKIYPALIDINGFISQCTMCFHGCRSFRNWELESAILRFSTPVPIDAANPLLHYSSIKNGSLRPFSSISKRRNVTLMSPANSVI